MNEIFLSFLNFDTIIIYKSSYLIISGRNRLRQMNGALFTGLNKLTDVFLYGNICIDTGYNGATEIASLYREVNDKCGFNSAIEDLITT